MGFWCFADCILGVGNCLVEVLCLTCWVGVIQVLWVTNLGLVVYDAALLVIWLCLLFGLLVVCGLC